MATRLSLDEKLDAIRRLRGGPLSAEQTAELKKAIADRSNFVVAAAAEIVGNQTLIELAGDLEKAFDRFMSNPIRDDKLCRAKIAIVQALDRVEHMRAAVFERASTHIQLEPVFGGSEDTAAPLRAGALIALARVEGSHSLARLVDAMVDPCKDVRIAVAQALAYLNTEAAGLLLRLKARIGDADPEVLSECLAALLADGSTDSLAIACEALESENEDRCEAAAIALGKSRRADAFEPLRDRWSRSYSAVIRQQVLLSIAMLRQSSAIDYLVELVGTASEKDALLALAALKVHSHDPRLRERLAPVVQATGKPTLVARFVRDFRRD